MTSDLMLQPEHSGWLQTPGLQRLFDLLDDSDEQTRVIGGAVRNSVLGEKIGDVDLATTLHPEQVMERLKKTDIKTIATGLSHGTLTAVVDHHSYEITTLRSDIETDGRHAVVAFGRSWQEDANRRDLTMNALYCDRHGKIYDPLNGYEDLLARRVRFIGDASERIEEDYLRILRFFRFFAQYGEGRPDGDGLKACAKLKSGIAKLSVERVWMELKKILRVSDPARALLWMRTTGVLSMALNESDKWGIDFVGDRINAEQDLGWSSEPLERLQVMVPPVADKMSELAKRLRFSKSEARRMVEWAKAILPPADISEMNLAKLLYQGEPQAIGDRVRNEIVRQRHIAREKDEALLLAAKYVKLLDQVEKRQRPVFPLQGKDLVKAGMGSGPKMGEKLKRLEQKWVDSGFSLGKKELLNL